MKVLITGACGHIGSYLIRKIHNIKKLKELILIDNLNTQRYSSLFKLSKKIKINFFQIDLCNKSSLNKFKKVDVVVHLASHTNAESSFSNKNKIFKNNLGLIKNVINYCIKNNTKLVHISSASVYGKQAKIVTENHEEFLNPQSPYAEIKLIEEKMLEKNKDKLKYISFRFGTIAGVSTGMRFHTAINKFCFDASFNDKIKVYKTAYKQYRPYLSLKDAYKAIKLCIENNLFKNDVFNVLTGNFTVEQIIKMIKKYKKKVSVEFVVSPIMNQLSYHVDGSKIKKLGINLNSNIEKDIKETIKLFSYNK